MRRLTATAQAGVIRLPDGRTVTFRAAGPSNGFPIVFCHGAIGAPRWLTPGLEAALDELGARYVVVDRPGYGGSDVTPGRTVADFATDLGRAMDRLGHHRFGVVGVSAGVPYALAAGWAMPGRVTSLVLVSSLGPPESTRGLRYRAALWPFGPGPIRERVATRALKLAGLARDTPPAAMIADYLVCRAPWGFDVSEVEIPVTMWHGRRDRLVPLAHGRRLAEALPTCEGCQAARGGHFFFKHDVATILRTVMPEEEPAELPALVA